MVDDFVVRDGRCVLRKVAHDEQRDMIAARDAMVEKDAVQDRFAGQADIALFHQFAGQRGAQSLAGLDAAAGQMPAGDVGVFDQEDAALAVDHHAEGAQSRAAGEAPVEMKAAPDERIKSAAQAVQSHGRPIAVLWLEPGYTRRKRRFAICAKGCAGPL